MIINLHFLIPAVITQNFTSATELVFPIGIPNYEANVEIETQQVTVEAKTSKCSV